MMCDSADRKFCSRLKFGRPSELRAGSEVLAKLCLIFVFLATLCLIFWATIALAVQKTKSLQWPNYASCGQIMVEIAFFPPLGGVLNLWWWVAISQQRDWRALFASKLPKTPFYLHSRKTMMS